MEKQMSDAIETIETAPVETTAAPEKVSSGDALDRAISEATGKQATEATETGLEAAPAPQPWDTPGWAKMWKEEPRKALEHLWANEQTRGLYDKLRPELDGAYSYIGRLQNEFGQMRQRMAPVSQLLSKYEPQYRLQGMTLEQGLGQLFEVAERLAVDPDNTFPYLASSYRPQNAQAAIAKLAEAWGVDITDVVRETPYVDPEVLQLRQQMAALREQQEYAQMGQRNALRSEVVKQLEAFEQAKDESGELLHPHFTEVFELIPRIFGAGMADTLEKAYQTAVQVHPTLGAKVQEAKLEAARKKAIDEAKARTEAAEKAERASRNFAGKGGKPSTAKRGMSLDDAFNAARSALET
jgi:hypothetical protein